MSEGERGGLVPGLMIVILALILALGALSLAARPAAGAAELLRKGFEQTQVATGISVPTTMAFAPDGRLFVAEQTGKLRVISKSGRLLGQPFIDLSGRVDSRGERGLLGIAFDPDFSSNQHVYLYFTRKATGTEPAHNRIVRFTADGNKAVAGSGRLILRLNRLSDKQNHNGGALHFGKDGKLYVAVGENANAKNAQSFKNLLGKMLRINKDGSIPKDNPYFDREKVKGKNKAIWARGLRNPYTFAVRPGTGTIFINDVGQQTWEEINRGIAGANYGWPYYEGPDRFDTSLQVPEGFKHRKPIHYYEHDPECAITGGTFYIPETVQFPASYVGDYFFADFCAGWIRTYDPATRSVKNFARGASRPVDLKVDRAGSLYYLERTGGGSVYRVEYSGG